MSNFLLQVQIANTKADEPSIDKGNFSSFEV